MHCLPSFHDFETKTSQKCGWTRALTSAKSPTRCSAALNSIVFDEAENRMHTIKAVLVAMLGA